ncbi:MAG: ribulose-phosphate 3-epimerase [Spirochaetes bacterium]|nr:ribulose-phosphate 3-epimerase [Spirochaetota bacterium]
MVSSRILVAPSILSADFSRMGEEIKKIEQSGGDWVHVDVMDGCFVPNITFGPKMVEDIRKYTSLPFDVHLMTVNPDQLIERFADAGADYITFHLEAVTHAHRTVMQIQGTGKKVGVSIVPSTPAFMLQELLSELDLVLVMTVNPGFGGQKLIPSCLEKVCYLNQLRQERGYRYLIAVDGGINQFTAPQAIQAGANVLVLGSAFFLSPDPKAEIAAVKGTKFV